MRSEREVDSIELHAQLPTDAQWDSAPPREKLTGVGFSVLTGG